jgi:hypothetical protein
MLIYRSTTCKEIRHMVSKAYWQSQTQRIICHKKSFKGVLSEYEYIYISECSPPRILASMISLCTGTESLPAGNNGLSGNLSRKVGVR